MAWQNNNAQEYIFVQFLQYAKITELLRYFVSWYWPTLDRKKGGKVDPQWWKMIIGGAVVP